MIGLDIDGTLLDYEQECPPRVNRVLLARVRQLAGEHPDWSRAELARAAGCDVSTVTRALHDG